MSLSAMLFGQDSAIHKVTNIMGLGIPGLLHKAFMPGDPKMAPQRLGELSQQTAKEGDPRPIVYGIGRPIGGNIMYMSQPVKRMVKTYVGKAGGKGGGKKKKQYQDVEHVYRYYAIRVCEGPITGFRRIWRNGALVYDARKGSDWGAKNNHLFFQNYRLYTGSWGQMPDSMLQSRWGMDIPAHRGTAYLVADNEDLTDFGGAIPQWQFEVVRSEGYYLTSRPYNLEAIESTASVSMLVKNGITRPTNAPTESTSAVDFSVQGGVLRKLLFDMSDLESSTAAFDVNGGVLRSVLQDYNKGLPESSTAIIAVTGGKLYTSIKYAAPHEDTTASFAITDGNLVTTNPVLAAPTDLQGVYSDV